MYRVEHQSPCQGEEFQPAKAGFVPVAEAFRPAAVE
jgi:hypothetical protein